MLLAILFFSSKMLDLLVTRIFLKHGLAESNIFYNKFGDGAMFYLIYLLTFIVYFIDRKFGNIKEIKDILKVYITISFIISIYNILSMLFT